MRQDATRLLTKVVRRLLRIGCGSTLLPIGKRRGRALPLVEMLEGRDMPGDALGGFFLAAWAGGLPRHNLLDDFDSGLNRVPVQVASAAWSSPSVLDNSALSADPLGLGAFNTGRWGMPDGTAGGGSFAGSSAGAALSSSFLGGQSDSAFGLNSADASAWGGSGPIFSPAGMAGPTGSVQNFAWPSAITFAGTAAAPFTFSSAAQSADALFAAVSASSSKSSGATAPTPAPSIASTLTSPATSTPTAPLTGASPKIAPLTGGGLAASGATVHYVEGGPAAFVQVATFTDGDGTTSFNAYTASINWGDGQTTNGVVTGSNGSFQVLGSHSYVEEGTFTITVSINDADRATVTAKSTAVVADAALSMSGNSLTLAAQPGAALNAAVAYFTDADPAGTLADYSATIKWGDKTSSSGTIGQTGAEGSQNYAVVASHTYASAGTYSVTVTIKDTGGSTLNVITKVNVASTNGPSGSLSATGATITPTEGQAIAGATVATFTDSDGNHLASAYSATINWGDGGQPTPGSITGPVGNVFSVISGKTYAEEGTYTTTITINDTDLASTQTNGMANVSDAALQPGTGIPVTAQATVLFKNQSLVTFSDIDPGGVAGDYTATIAWGDGGTSLGTVTGPSSGRFTVHGDHRYLDEDEPPNQPKTVTVTIKDAGGSQLVASTSATVNSAPLPPNGPARKCTGCPPTNALAKEMQSGPDPTADRDSIAPIRYFDGVIELPITDLESDGFGTTWGQTRSFTNANGYYAAAWNGFGMVDSQLPTLIQGNGGNTIAMDTTGDDARLFDLSGGNYVEHFFLEDKLTHDTTNNLFTLTDTAGNQITFYDFSTTAWPIWQQGSFKSFTDPYGNVTQVPLVGGHTSDGRITEVDRSNTSNGTTITESYLYTYYSGGATPDFLENVTLCRSVNGGTCATVRQVNYSYYDGTLPYGDWGDLLFATVADGAGNVLDTTYYRYYLDNEQYGYQDALKYYFSPTSYARLVAAVTNPELATDAQVSQYADNYYQYDNQQRVTEEIAQGMGCSSCAGGLGTFTFAYNPSANALGFNNWAMKTVETMPDNNQNIVYTNGYGEVMLFDYHDVTSGLNWDTYAQYDGVGRYTLMAAPSAVTGYNDASANLGVSLSASSGLITTFDYYSSTTATETTAGGVAGYEQDYKIQQGQSGTPITQETEQYFAHSAFGQTIAPIATDTVYRNTNANPETTSYSYTWVTNTAGQQSATVTMPIVTAAENGPGTADVDTTFYDTTYGRAIWHKDADGFLTYIAYDQATGAVIKTIDDVDTTKTGEFINLPTGWVTPSGGGLHLVTQMGVDALGRDVQVNDPNGNVTYETYNDPNHETRVYRGWNLLTNMPTGPTELYREDRPGSYVEALTMTATPHLTGSVPDGTEAVSGLQTLSRSYTNAAGQFVSQDDYFNLNGVTYSTASHIGSINSNYFESLTAYDARGRENRVQTPNGTIYRTVYDGLNRPVSSWVGTNDTPGSGYWSPTNNTPPSNMVQVAAYVYDNGGVGDGNLTQETDMPGGTAANRVTNLYYDWRDRLVASKSGVQGTEDLTTHRPIIFTVYDNLDEATTVQQYDGDGVTITSTNGVPNAPAPNLLRAQTNISYDEQGRTYQTQTYDVNPSTGAVSTSALTENVYYNHRGLVIEDAAPGGLVSKDQYDGVGRVTVEYTTDGASGTSWSSAGSATGDNVLEQVETTYDNNSNAIMVTDRQRNHDETATGPLGNETTTPKARVYYSTAYYDSVDRLTASVDVGTNGGTAYTRPSSVPAASDTVLVSSASYNPAGWLGSETDPRAIVSNYTYDNLGRTTQTIEDYVAPGTPTNTTNKTTQFAYDGDNNLTSLTAVEPNSKFETTKYLYGVTTSTSDVNSNDILGGMQYPDPTTGVPSASQQETYTVNALADTKTVADRNGNVHTLSYDVLGRMTSDAVTTLGTGVDGSVRRIEIAYDTQDNPYLFTSFDAASGGNIVNQVQRGFNGLAQLTTEYQSHSGAVNTGTTPKVQYGYTDLSAGNNSRLTSMTYPNLKVLNYYYTTTLDNSISRLTSLSDNTGTLESYSYLGLDTVVQRARTQISTNLTYIKQGMEPNGDAGDQYTGLDRFGRVVDQRWWNTSTSTATDRFKYGYDPDSNALYRTNEVNHNFDELYHANGAGNGYDQLNQLSGFLRGVLSDTNSDGIPDTVASASTSETWSPDALGNFSSITTNASTQTRTHNQQNEITSISGLTTPTYDANGNLTKDELGQTYTFDAWNRLVQVKNSGSTVIASYSYDGLGRRIQETHSGTVNDLYYSAAWQVLEERTGGVSTATVQYVWSPVYVDALVQRDRSTQNNGTLDETLWVQQDANWNVTALVNSSGQVVERYIYDPYGQVTVLNASWGTISGSAYAWAYGFQGLRLDTATGNDDERERQYRATLARFLQNDPLGIDAGDTNFYRDEGNNPVDFNDPIGLEPPKPLIPIPENWGLFGGYVRRYTIVAIANGVYAEGENAVKVGGKVIEGDVGGAVKTHAAFTLGKCGELAPGLLPTDKVVKDLTGKIADSISQEDAERGRLAAPATEAALVVVTAKIGSPATKGPKTRGVWDLPPGPRGEAIEKTLGQNLPQNFPVIDKFENGIATSIKSMDLKSTTYLKVENLTSKGECYIDKVAGFRGRTWAGVEVKGADIKGRALELAVPAGEATPEQQAALKALIEYGKSKGVTVTIKEVK